MENSNGTSNLRNFPYGGRQTQFPPKSPFQHISPPSDDYIFSPAVGSKGIPKPTEVQKRHQRTPSESFLREEQPSWLDELLNEPETPLHRGHRRSSSDSFAYLDAAAKVSEKEEQKFINITAEPSWGSQNFDHYRDLWHASLYQKPNSFDKKQIGAWESSLNSVTYSSGLPSCSHGISPQTSGSSCSTQEPDGVPSISIEKQGRKESSSHNRDDSSEISDCSHAKPSVSRTDSNRSKQQFAQRSRVRKLQYIAELERNVQALQAEGSEVSAELEFLNRQNLILNMENRALKQRLDSLSQEQLIKHMEQDLLKKEIGRLQTLYQQQLQQQQRQQQHSAHRRSKSRDLDSQFSKLSIKHKEASSSGSESGGSLQI